MLIETPRLILREIEPPGDFEHCARGYATEVAAASIDYAFSMPGGHCVSASRARLFGPA